MTALPAPTNAEHVQNVIKERLDEASKQQGATITIDWRDDILHLPVITMPTNLLLYNPETHRIRAQIDVDPKLATELTANPWSEDSQEYLNNLLKCLPSKPTQVDPEFIQLRDNLESFGQKEPGLITPDGVLVNGNTRCAALRELGEQYIRVGVLPSSTTWDDVNEVELSLQLRKEFKRDYSFINRLIAVEDLISKGHRIEDIARSFHTKVQSLKNDRWIYGLIQGAIKRSQTHAGTSLVFADFEDHQEKLRELQRAYSKLEPTNHDQAEILKETRLALIILEFSKTDLRLAQPDFGEKYLNAKLPNSLKILAGASDNTEVNEIPGLPGLQIPADSVGLAQTKKLTDALLQAKASQKLDRMRHAESVTHADSTLKEAARAVERALEPAGRAERLRKRKLAAPERLSDACDDIDLCTQDLVEARAKQALDLDAVEEACKALKKSLSQLAIQLQISTEMPDESVKWLISAVQDTASE